eukprot:GFYU01008150.1.p1 GENE.GFYU01008150.1~~GFYU01008150.1.p1  ORF type:complete len:474 (-),score=126.12 GFYU01008150.1:131-1552(-)
MGNQTSCSKPQPGEHVRVGDRALTIKKLVAEGGFSFVYLATDSAGEKYALKKILAQSPEQVKAVEWEIEVCNKLKHTNLLPLLDSGQRPHKKIAGAQDFFLLMPFYASGTVQDSITNREPSKAYFEESEVIAIFRQVCDGVKAIHDAGFAHRDLKPANALLGAEDNIVIMDFGSVRKSRQMIMTRTDGLNLQDEAAEHSTAPFRAPELFDVPTNSVIDERTDVWSLGCILYNIMYLASPFEYSLGEIGGSIQMAVMSGQFTIPEEPAYSSDLIDTVKLMLQLDPQNRPFVEDVLGRLDKIVAGHRVSTTAADIAKMSDHAGGGWASNSWATGTSGEVASSAGSSTHGGGQQRVRVIDKKQQEKTREEKLKAQIEGVAAGDAAADAGWESAFMSAGQAGAGTHTHAQPHAQPHAQASANGATDDDWGDDGDNWTNFQSGSMSPSTMSPQLAKSPLDTAAGGEATATTDQTEQGQ